MGIHLITCRSNFETYNLTLKNKPSIFNIDLCLQLSYHIIVEWFDKIKDKKTRDEFLYKSPSLKLMGILGFTILSGILPATFLNDIISASGKPQWKLFYTSTYFYIILVLIGILWLYYNGMYKYDNYIRNENDVLKFGNPEYLKAYINKECLPELVALAKKAWKNGTIDQFFKTLDQLHPNKRLKNENSD
jgi:hypothetical protein